MSRRHSSVKREIYPDAKYKSVVVMKFINNLMLQGKKSVAESLVYKSFDILKVKLQKDPLEVFYKALENIKPSIEVRSRRVGGATYQVPMDVRDDRAQALSFHWLISVARKRGERTMIDRLAAEVMDAYSEKGAAVKKRDDTHRMAEANRAFSHYRW